MREWASLQAGRALREVALLLAGRPLELPLRELHHRLAGHQGTRYDIQTLRILRRVLPPAGNAVDVGCHAGQFLAAMLRIAPRGRHFAFEPLAHLHQALLQRFAHAPGAQIHGCALGDTDGRTSFQHVLSNPAYSGLRLRRYDRPDERVQTIEVPIRRLDDVLPGDLPIHFIKIDVEGAELQVLLGARATLMRWRPVVVFEHGVGAADWYGTTPRQVHALLADCGMQVLLMSDWLQGRMQALTAADLQALFDSRTHYYFMAVACDEG